MTVLRKGCQVQTYGEMPRADKEEDNHRARAFRQLDALLPPVA